MPQKLNSSPAQNHIQKYKITDYFLKIGGTTEIQLNRNKNLPPRNNDLPDSTVNATFQNYEVANIKKTYLTNNYSNSQILSE